MVCSREMGGWEGTNDLEGGDDGWLVKGIVACGGLKDKGGNKWGCLWDISWGGLAGAGSVDVDATLPISIPVRSARLDQLL